LRLRLWCRLRRLPLRRCRHASAWRRAASGTALRRSAAPIDLRMNAVYPDIALAIKGSVAIMRVPISGQRKRDDGKLKPRSVFDDGNAVALIRIAEIGCVNPATVIGKNDIAPT